MKTIEIKSVKKTYNSPEIIYIELDNEISLALESIPPEGPGEGPGEGATWVSEYMEDDPFL